MTTQEYLENINKRFITGISREHSYRGDLQTLIESLANGVLVTNEPARIKCGAPDFIITKKDIPVGYIEAKDIGKDLHGKEFKEQFDRYRKSLNNLIITDYLDFHLYIDGKFVTSIKIAKIENGKIKPLPQNFEQFTTLIKDFCSYIGQTITNSKKLAEMMAGKARILAQVINEALKSDDETNANSTLKEQMQAFQDVLIHDITPKEFADIYAQTIAYGMFAARLHDPHLPSFSRQEAAELIPKSNPFLRKLFQHIAGFDLDDRIKWIVDALADIFRATDVKALLKNFGKATQATDPIIHFYETFLAEYDPKLRKTRGVWYTPEPVVNFIVRAVDDILKTEFNLPQGLADTTKTKITLDTQTRDERTSSGYKQIEKEVHKVQILDPATGTGTFLAEVVKQIYRKFEGQQGIWSNYVENHLIPRLNGFELLMASYTMAHLKLDMLFSETGYKPTTEQRLKIYLTNSLEEHHPDTGTLFAGWLSREANEANHIKRDTPVMCVIGNPPYSVSSSNKSKWIESLTADYKKDLNERNIQPLSDDYIKFIRFGQYFIDKNGEGILAYISNNSFIDGIIHRQMRKHLLESFDKIYILDLHGNAKKKEVCLDGSPDQNVFDIMQGVSINIFVKTDKKKKNELGGVFHFDLQGKREAKYEMLIQNSIKTIEWKKLDVKEPSFYLVKKDFSEEQQYEKGFAIIEIFPFKSSGIKTHDDANLVSNSFVQLKENIVRLNHIFETDKVYDYSYRPFDNGCIFYDTKLLGRAREKTIYHLKKENLGLILVAQPQAANLTYFDCVFITKSLTDTNMFRRGGPVSFPLYLYPDTGEQSDMFAKESRTPNLNLEIVKQIADKLGLEFEAEKNPKSEIQNPQSFSPIDILDYVYAVLHSPNYREKYKEFLKIDFPRVPYPKDAATFWQLAELGGELRQIHLLESPKVEEFITTYPKDGDNIVTRKMTQTSIGFELTDTEKETSRVWINGEQYFDNVPLVAWEFYIGGYQPAQKWLKDRFDRELSFEDIRHYQKIIAALTETHKIMRKIDKIELE
ncbi:MAG: type ISP restriction/modification enzyme [Pyrinomonadaceae bacterium]